MRALMFEAIGETALGGNEVDLEAFDTSFSPVVGEKSRSTSFHQSISVAFSIPHSLNHFFKPNPTKNWAFG